MSSISFNVRIIISAITKAKKLSRKRDSLAEKDTSGCYPQMFTCMSMSVISVLLLEETRKILSSVSYARCLWLIECSLLFFFFLQLEVRQYSVAYFCFMH